MRPRAPRCGRMGGAGSVDVAKTRIINRIISAFRGSAFRATAERFVDTVAIRRYRRCLRRSR
ncbi:MAG TPA: hypothetical protein VKP30_29235, partial [Polyangiaceae bacterium]|nr:hypothetical protein [Polyangiaceae bacterium]